MKPIFFHRKTCGKTNSFLKITLLEDSIHLVNSK